MSIYSETSSLYTVLWRTLPHPAHRQVIESSGLLCLRRGGWLETAAGLSLAGAAQLAVWGGGPAARLRRPNAQELGSQRLTNKLTSILVFGVFPVWPF